MSYTINGSTYFRSDIVSMCNNPIECVLILCRFIDENGDDAFMDKGDEIAEEVARAVLDSYGPIVMDSFECFYLGKFETLMSARDWINCDCDSVATWLIRRAFRKHGFKLAGECTSRELRGIYAHAGFYAYAKSKKGRHESGFPKMKAGDITYDYAQIEKDNHAINTEMIARVVYSPDRIREWIEAGNKLEDYLN